MAGGTPTAAAHRRAALAASAPRRGGRNGELQESHSEGVPALVLVDGGPLPSHLEGTRGPAARVAPQRRGPLQAAMSGTPPGSAAPAGPSNDAGTAAVNAAMDAAENAAENAAESREPTLGQAMQHSLLLQPLLLR